MKPKTELLNALSEIASGTASDMSVKPAILSVLLTQGYAKRRGNGLKLTSRGEKLLPVVHEAKAS